MNKIFRFIFIVVVLSPILLLFIFLLFHKLVPAPLDIITGVYFPWLNYHYLGLSTPTPVKNPLISDVVSQVIPWYFHIHRFLNIPFQLFWNRFSLAGYPFLGSSYLTSIFNPFNLFIFSLPNFLTALHLQVIFQILILSTSFYFFLRTLNTRRVYAIFGAIVLPFTSLFTTWFEFGGGVYYAMAGTIFTLTCLNLYFLHRRVRYLYWLPLTIYLTVASGAFQVTLYGFIFVFAYGIYLFHQTRPHFQLKEIIQFVYLNLIAFGLISVIILPIKHIYSQSIRTTDQYIQQRHHGTLTFKHLITFIAPDYWGHPSTYNYRGEWNYHEKASYLGLTIIALWFFSLFFSSRKLLYKHFFDCGALLTLLFVTQNPLSQAIYSLPIPIISTSSASRLLFLFSFLVLTSVVLYLSYFFDHRNHLLRRRYAFFLLSVIVIIDSFTLFLLLKQLWLYYLDPIHPLIFPTNQILHSKSISLIYTSLRNLFFPTIFVLFISFITLLFSRREVYYFFSFVFITLFSLYQFFIKYNPFSYPQLFYPQTKIIKQLQLLITKTPSRVQFYGTAVVPPNFWEIYSLESASGYHSLYPRIYGEFVGLLNDGKFNLTPGRYLDITNPSSSLFNFLNIKYVVVNTESCKPWFKDKELVCQITRDHRFKLIDQNKNLALYRNTGAFPRAFLVDKYQVANDKQTIANLLSTTDLSNTVILNKNPSFSSSNQSISLSYTLDITQYSNAKLTFKGKTNKPALLVISNTYDSGWHALVNDKPVSLIRANYAFQAIPLPEGEFNVTLTYFPPYLKLGLTISALSFLLYLVSVKIWLTYESRHQS